VSRRPRLGWRGSSGTHEGARAGLPAAGLQRLGSADHARPGLPTESPRTAGFCDAQGLRHSRAKKVAAGESLRRLREVHCRSECPEGVQHPVRGLRQLDS
jgi:hypothetical protein